MAQVNSLPASQRVFNITELLEQILLELQPRDIVSSIVPVCRNFNRTVRNSTPIRQHLFLDAGPPLETDDEEWIDRAYTTWLKRRTNPFSEPRYAKLIHLQFDFFLADDALCANVMVLHLHEYPDDDPRWQMQLANPPIFEGVIVGLLRDRDSYGRFGETRCLRIELAEEGGITYGDAYDAVYGEGDAFGDDNASVIQLHERRGHILEEPVPTFVRVVYE